jgi:hypothetical protein
MNGGDKGRKELHRLADAMLDDILNASDDEILNEAIEDGDDAEADAARLRDAFCRALLGAGKAKMAAAKQALAEYKSQRLMESVRPVLPKDRSARLAALNPMVGSKLTLAARKGGDFTQEDIDGLLDDDAELARLTGQKSKP